MEPQESLNIDWNPQGQDSNAFSLMGSFRKQARREGHDPATIQAILDEAMSGDYNHLVATLTSHVKPK